MRYDSGIRKCPRCGEKNLSSQKKCAFCGLVFERLKYCSNKSARKEVIKFRKRNYIMTKEWPDDASKKVALLLCGFLGLFGAHNFYLGRFYKGITVLFGFICSVILLFLPYKSLAYNIIWYISLLPAACVLIFWAMDFIKIFLERYKIPISIDKKLYDLKNQTVVVEDNKNENENILENKKGSEGIESDVEVVDVKEKKVKKKNKKSE